MLDKKQKRTFSFRFLFASISLVAIIIIGTYLYLNDLGSREAPDLSVRLEPFTPEESFSTYSSDYGYQISYPKDWEFIDADPTLGSVGNVIASPEAISASQEGYSTDVKKIMPLVNFSCYDTWSGVTDRWLSLEDKGRTANIPDLLTQLTQVSKDYQYTEPTKYILGLTELYGVGGSPKGYANDFSQYTFFLKTNEISCTISFMNRENYSDLSDQELKILKSIKLIPRVKQNIYPFSPEDLDWKSYKEDNYNIKFELPSKWTVEAVDGWLEIKSDDYLKYQKICSLGMANCDGLAGNIHLKKYGGLDELKKAHDISDNSQDILEYISNRMKEDSLVNSVDKFNVGESEGFMVGLSGLCGSWEVLWQKGNNVYEVNFDCEGPTKIEQRILESITSAR